MNNLKVCAIAAAAVMGTVTLVGCGSVVIDKLNSRNDTAAAAQTVKQEQPVQAAAKSDTAPAAEIKAEELKAEEAQPEAAKTEKKTSKKKKSSKKSEEKTETKAEPAKTEITINVQQPATVIPAATANTNTNTNTNTNAKTNTNTNTNNTDNNKAADSAKYTPVVYKDVYSGTYVERSRGVATMNIENVGGNTYSVHVDWRVNNSEVNSWDMTGEFNGRGVMNYLNCRKTTAAYDANGNYTVGTDGIQTPFTTYTAGAGSLKLTDGGIEWTDNMGDILAGTTFVKTEYYTVPAAPELVIETKTEDYRPLPTGVFFDGNGSSANIEIIKEANNTYRVTVTAPLSLGEYYVWSFSGNVNGDAINYSDCVKSKLTYDDFGNVIDAKIMDENNCGRLSMSNTGLVWINADDSASYVFAG